MECMSRSEQFISEQNFEIAGHGLVRIAAFILYISALNVNPFIT